MEHIIEPRFLYRDLLRFGGTAHPGEFWQKTMALSVYFSGIPIALAIIDHAAAMFGLLLVFAAIAFLRLLPELVVEAFRESGFRGSAMLLLWPIGAGVLCLVWLQLPAGMQKAITDVDFLVWLLFAAEAYLLFGVFIPLLVRRFRDTGFPGRVPLFLLTIGIGITWLTWSVIPIAVTMLGVFAVCGFVPPDFGGRYMAMMRTER